MIRILLLRSAARLPYALVVSGHEAAERRGPAGRIAARERVGEFWRRAEVLLARRARTPTDAGLTPRPPEGAHAPLSSCKEEGTDA